MDFKVALTYGSGAPAKSYAPIPSLTLDPSLEDLPTMDEEDLACSKSFAKLYLIGKVLGESVSLKSISSKMKAEWKTSGESCFMDLAMTSSSSNFLLLRIVLRYRKKDFFSSKNKLLSFKNGEKSLILLVRPLRQPLFGPG